MGRKIDSDEDRDRFGILAAATMEVVALTTEDDAVLAASDTLLAALLAVDELGKMYRSLRPELAATLRLHAVGLRDVVTLWNEDAQRTRPRARERPRSPKR